MLLVWEDEWYWIFHGLVYGAKPRRVFREFFTPPRPPKFRIIKELQDERLRNWRERSKNPANWRRRKYMARRKSIPAERKIWQLLENSTSSISLANACAKSRFWLNPAYRPVAAQLAGHAAEFLKCKNYRYPSSGRPASEKKRILHFARAMAGIMEGIGAVRAIDLFRLLRHGNKCRCVQCDLKSAVGMAIPG